MPSLRLTVTDYVGPTRWRWELCDSGGTYVADFEVHLDPTSREYGGFVDLSGYLAYHAPITPVEEQLAQLGGWIGERVFGRLREALWERRAKPAVAVHLAVPLAAPPAFPAPYAEGRALPPAQASVAALRCRSPGHEAFVSTYGST